MVPRKFLHLPDRLKVHILNIHEMAKVVLVGKDEDFIIEVFKVMKPSLERFNNSL